MDHGRILALDTVDRLIEAYGGGSVVAAELARVPDDLSSLRGDLDGASLRIATSEPFEEIARLAATGIPLVSLRVDRPDLENVFLALTGRSLRD
jgi:ABC-2 type transport system ATP-binding protein